MTPAGPSPPSKAAGSGADAASRVRRYHRKSRRGCRPCKASRIKCDEIQPTCSNCARKATACHYFETVCIPINEPKQRIRILPLRCSSPRDAPPPAPKRRPSPPKPSGSALAIYCPSPITVGTPSDGLLDRRLLHHYHTIATRSPTSQLVWSTWAVDIAVRTPSVMDAVLGFSAFHLRRLGHCDWAVREASHKYMARAIRSHQEQVLAGINETNAAPLLASCALILFHTSINQDYMQVKAGPRLPLHWFYPFQSVRNLFSMAWPSLRDSAFGQDIKRRFGGGVRASARRRDEFDFLLGDMEPECSMDEKTVSAYQLAVAHLSYSFSSPQFDKLLQFPAFVTPRFVELVEAQDPRALAISGYFFMLIKLGRVLWWVDGAADREFAATMAFLPKDWWPMMDWAIREFNWSPSGSEIPVRATLLSLEL